MMRGKNYEEQASGATLRPVTTKPILASAAAIRMSMASVVLMPRKRKVIMKSANSPRSLNSPVLGPHTWWSVRIEHEDFL